MTLGGAAPSRDTCVQPRPSQLLQTVASIVAENPDLSGVVRALGERETVVLEGLTGSYRAAVLARLQEAVGRPLAVVLPQGVDREALLLDLRAFHPAGEGHGRVVAFPPLGVDPYGTLTPHPDHIRERIQTLDRCAGGRVDIVLAPMLSWLERLQARDRFLGSTLKIAVGTELPPDELVAALVAAGYQRHSLVESLGEIAVRGGIVDVFPPTREHPVRLEYFGDEIESIREFNPRDQRSMRSIESVELPPAREHFDLAASIVGEISEIHETTRKPGIVASPGEDEAPGGGATLADYLVDPLWVEIEPESFAEEEKDWAAHLDEHYHRALADGRDAALPDDLYGTLDEGLHRTDGGRVLMRELATEGTTSGAVKLIAQPAPSFQGRMAELAETITKSLAEGERICLAMSRPGSAQRLAEVLEEYGVPIALSLANGEAGNHHPPTHAERESAEGPDSHQPDAGRLVPKAPTGRGRVAGIQ